MHNYASFLHDSFYTEMNVCKHCGSNSLDNSNYGSNSTLFRKDENSDISWFCFGKCCSRNSDDDSEIIEITTTDVPQFGSYKRRKTIQFDLDTTSTSASKPTNKAKHSILKTVNNVKVRETVFVFNILSGHCSSNCFTAVLILPVDNNSNFFKISLPNCALDGSVLFLELSHSF